MSLVIKTQYLRIDRIAQSGCALGNRVKQRLKIACRFGDHPQDVAGDIFPLQRLGEFVAQLGNCLCLFGPRRFYRGTTRFCLGML